ncbi:MAG: DUF559 domain-containing protein [Mycobacteriales bacterium]
MALRRGVYVEGELLAFARADPAALHLLRAEAALVALARPGWLSGLSAAVALNAALVTGPPAYVEVSTCVEGRAGATAAAGLVIRRCQLPCSHRAVARGVPVTSPARTIFDLSRRLPFRDAVVAADSLLHRHPEAAAQLEQVLRDCWTWPGAIRANRVAAAADPAAESALESIGRLLLRGSGLPAPRTQAPVGRDRVDFLWPRYRTVGEADGLLKYDDAEP